jgi:hypothetical protein
VDYSFSSFLSSQSYSSQGFYHECQEVEGDIRFSNNLSFFHSSNFSSPSSRFTAASLRFFANLICYRSAQFLFPAHRQLEFSSSESMILISPRLPPKYRWPASILGSPGDVPNSPRLTEPADTIAQTSDVCLDPRSPG